LWTWDVAGASSRWQTTVTIPVALHGMRIDADAPARQAIDRSSFHAIAVQPPRTWLREARPADAVRYGAAVVFVSGGAYVERAGTWIAGGAEADLFILQDRPAPVHLFVRNAPVENQISLDADGWRQTLALAPREERLLELPAPPPPIHIASAAGARPVDFVPGSPDRRILG